MPAFFIEVQCHRYKRSGTTDTEGNPQVVPAGHAPVTINTEVIHRIEQTPEGGAILHTGHGPIQLAETYEDVKNKINMLGLM